VKLLHQLEHRISTYLQELMLDLQQAIGWALSCQSLPVRPSRNAGEIIKEKHFN